MNDSKVAASLCNQEELVSYLVHRKKDEFKDRVTGLSC